jgi:hypothetical protein
MWTPRRGLCHPNAQVSTLTGQRQRTRTGHTKAGRDLLAGAEKTSTISGLVLSAGTHAFTVVVNEGQKIAESDYSDNSYSADRLTCS